MSNNYSVYSRRQNNNVNNQIANNANNSVTSEIAEADTTNSMVQPNTPQQPTRNENGSNNNSPTSK